MGYTLGPVATQDNYVNATTKEVYQECVRMTGFVSGAAVFYQLRLEPDSNWSEEKYIGSVPNFTLPFSYDRHFNAVRFRSAVAGTPATIAVELLTRADVPNA